ncbi:MAG TPA: deoxyribonuclease IV [Terriglobia bacterium]|nr:deoxyribonuclease IV [Terriglobia bacterium]
MLVGVHTSIAGALENAAHHARKIGCDAFQMFSANPRGWRAATPTAEACDRFKQVRASHGLAPLAIHDNYLINLASGDQLIRDKSIAAFRGELERALALGSEFLVTHPGSAMTRAPSVAVATCIESLLQSAKGLRLNGLRILIENTAGQGTAIGRTLEEVAEIMHGAARDLPMGACIDTAHCFAAGYPIHTEAGLRDTVKKLDSTVGLKNVCVIHANDSKAMFDSRVDRHEHIGKGKIGVEAFARIVRHPKLRSIPFICETPVDRPGDDKRNLRTMRKLAGGHAVGQHR